MKPLIVSLAIKTSKSISTRAVVLFSTSSSVRVTTYNVLSSHLASEDYFTACVPAALKAENRLPQLMRRLDREVKAKSIICLQEVSCSWAGRLHTFFSSHNYHFITGLYGGKFDGYMGVAVAVPMERYKIEKTEVVRVADTMKWPPRREPSRFRSLLRSLPVLGWLHDRLVPPPAINCWDAAASRMNQIICLSLSPRTKQSPSSAPSFTIANYHMPCMFRTPQAMMVHCALSAQFVKRFAGEEPYIFAGDFNIKPRDAMYKLLTRGAVDPEDPSSPEILVDNNWKCEVGPMKSAYFEKLGMEPPFTNWAKVRDEPDFVDTLDYIFLSKHWRVDDVQRLPRQSEVTGPLPTLSEPSDHLLLAASVSLEEKAKGTIL